MWCSVPQSTDMLCVLCVSTCCAVLCFPVGLPACSQPTHPGHQPVGRCRAAAAIPTATGTAPTAATTAAAAAGVCSTAAATGARATTSTHHERSGGGSTCGLPARTTKEGQRTWADAACVAHQQAATAAAAVGAACCFGGRHSHVSSSFSGTTSSTWQHHRVCYTSTAGSSCY